MKTKISGWICLVLSVLIFLFISLTLTSLPDYRTQELAGSAQTAGIIVLVVSIAMFVVSIGMIRLKKWSWYPAIVLSVLATFINIFSLIQDGSFWFFFTLLIAIGLFVIYSLISERKLFYKNE